MLFSGQIKSLFQKRMRIRLPGQDIFSSEKPQYYEPQDFYVGASVNLQEFRFEIETADEYTFNYMEQHCNEVADSFRCFKFDFEIFSISVSKS